MNDNKRIAVNTIFLYAKFIITTVVSFVMSRVVLQALGASDYGLYNVVGGIVAMLNTLGTSMVATSYRYMAVEIGKGEAGNPNKTYNTIVVVHFALAIFLLLIGETLGVFYVNNYLNVSLDKIPDALFVLHLSLLTTAFSVITIPMNGLIIAREKFLFTSVVESLGAILKLALVFLLINYEGNRLRLYAIILAIIQLSIPLAYQIYCRIKDSDIVRWSINRNKEDYKNLFGFAWWTLFGAVAVIGKLQGSAMIINFFFGTILNAAYGLASQVNHALSAFTSTLRQSAIPQIMKSYSSGDHVRSLKLVYTISRYSYLSMMVFSVPLLFGINAVLKIWLGVPPEFTQTFVIFMLISGMVANLGAGFDALIQATGVIRNYEIGYAIINLALLPLIYLLYLLGLPPYVNVICMLFLAVITLLFQIYYISRVTTFSVREYFMITIFPSLRATLLTVIPLYLIGFVWDYNDNLWTAFSFIGIAIILTIIVIYCIGLTVSERAQIRAFILKKVLRSK